MPLLFLMWILKKVQRRANVMLLYTSIILHSVIDNLTVPLSKGEKGKTDS